VAHLAVAYLSKAGWYQVRVLVHNPPKRLLFFFSPFIWVFTYNALVCLSVCEDYSVARRTPKLPGMSNQNPSTPMKIAEDQINSSSGAESPMEKSGVQVADTLMDGGIDPENEVTGAKLILLHTGLCLCTFLTGLVSLSLSSSRSEARRAERWSGLQFDRHRGPGNHLPLQLHWGRRMVRIGILHRAVSHHGWTVREPDLTMSRCVSQPLAGKTFTLFPKKLMYLAYLVIFEVGSLVCALAPSSKALIVGRAITGLGASGIFAGGLVILTTIIPLHKRAIWTGTMNSTFVIASIVGPVIGGALTQHVTWRWCFFLNLPIGGFSAAVLVFFFHIKHAPTEGVPFIQKLKALDGVGFTLFGGSVAMLLLALQWGGPGAKYAWNSSIIIGLFVGSGVSIPLFVAWQLYLQESALIPPRLFVNRNIGLIFSSAMFSNGPFQCIVYWLPIWFQAVLGVSPTASGVRYLATVIPDVLTSLIGSGIVIKLGTWNPFLIFGTAMVSLGGGLLTTLKPGISDGHWIGYQIFGGIGYSLIINMVSITDECRLKAFGLLTPR
jgi:MFS family permease